MDGAYQRDLFRHLPFALKRKQEDGRSRPPEISRSSLIPFGVFDIQQRTVVKVGDLHSHDGLVTGHQLISDHLQVCL